MILQWAVQGQQREIYDLNNQSYFLKWKKVHNDLNNVALFQFLGTFALFSFLYNQYYVSKQRQGTVYQLWQARLKNLWANIPHRQSVSVTYCQYSTTTACISQLWTTVYISLPRHRKHCNKTFLMTHNLLDFYGYGESLIDFPSV